VGIPIVFITKVYRKGSRGRPRICQPVVTLFAKELDPRVWRTSRKGHAFVFVQLIGVVFMSKKLHTDLF
jgi:hypothetical protein